MSKQRAVDFERAQGNLLLARLGEPRRFIQVVAGPRQVGNDAGWSGAGEALGSQRVRFGR